MGTPPNILLLFLLLAPCLRSAKITLHPSTLTANSQASLVGAPLTPSNYSMHSGDRVLCHFTTSLIPCACTMVEASAVVLKENGQPLIRNISIVPPSLGVILPKTHEMLQELQFTSTPKLCKAQNFTFSLRFRPFDIMPFDESPWTTEYKRNVTLHDQRVTISIPCDSFYRQGYYAVEVSSSRGAVVETSSWMSVTPSSSSSSLRLLTRSSIFPSCTDSLTVEWSLPRCLPPLLSSRLRLLAVPPDDGIHRGEIYLEEIMISPSSSSLAIGCSQFDILFEQYCFELISVHEKSHSFHLWNSLCINTEPKELARAKWTTWTEWTPCSASCGEGVTRRERECSSPSSSSSTLRCEEGDAVETKECRAAIDCPTPRPLQSSPSCRCGCVLSEGRGSFLASSSCPSSPSIALPFNRTAMASNVWRIDATGERGAVADILVEHHEVVHEGDKADTGQRLLIFASGPHEKLLWKSSEVKLRRKSSKNRGSVEGKTTVPDRKWSLSLPLDNDDLFFVYEHSGKESASTGFSVIYNIRVPVSSSALFSSSTSCPSLLCTESVALFLLVLLLLLLVSVPPIVCAALTRRLSKGESGGEKGSLLPSGDVDAMIRSGNTECTQVSVHRNSHVGSHAARMVAKRSIGIQLSVQSTPRVGRHLPLSSDSPLTTARGGSSLSNMDDLEYDDYDGSLMPGSLLRGVPFDRHSSIDIDQLIAEAEEVIGGVEKATAATQADDHPSLP